MRSVLSAVSLLGLPFNKASAQIEVVDDVRKHLSHQAPPCRGAPWPLQQERYRPRHAHLPKQRPPFRPPTSVQDGRWKHPGTGAPPLFQTLKLPQDRGFFCATGEPLRPALDRLAFHLGEPRAETPNEEG